MDAKKKFLEAGQRYVELSIRFHDVLTDSERTGFLEHAVLAALLGEASQQRTRLLAFLYKDERCHSLPVFSILERMYAYFALCFLRIINVIPLLFAF